LHSCGVITLPPLLSTSVLPHRKWILSINAHNPKVGKGKRIRQQVRVVSEFCGNRSFVCPAQSSRNVGAQALMAPAIPRYSSICPVPCRRTFLCASSEYCKKPSTIRPNTVGESTSKYDCGEHRKRFISRLRIPARALTAKRRRRAEVSDSSAWRSEFGWLTEGLRFNRSRWVEPPSMFVFHSGQTTPPNGQRGKDRPFLGGRISFYG
jgi:hypothetical protein